MLTHDELTAKRWRKATRRKRLHEIIKRHGPRVKIEREEKPVEIPQSVQASEVKPTKLSRFKEVVKRLIFRRKV